MTVVTVVGSVNLDLVVPVSRLPRPGETVMGSGVEYRQGGKGANQAVAARRLGGEVRFFGACGDDEFAAGARSGLRSHGVDVGGLVSLTGSPTGVALVVVQSDGENTVTVAPGANAALAPEHLRELPETLRNADILLLQMEIETATNVAAARLGREAGVPVVLNAAPPRQDAAVLAELLRMVDVLVVNQIEAAHLMPGSMNAADTGWEQHAVGLRRLGPAITVLTLGSAGAVAAYDGGTCVQRGFDVEAVDGTGAGDVFCGALAMAFGAGRTAPDALARACAAGALATTRLGAQSAAPTDDEVRHLLDGGR